jgi:hypothetical protein
MKQTAHQSLLITLVVLAGATVTKPVALEAAEKPNIVLTMADDMGYKALSVNGGESCKSPNLGRRSVPTSSATLSTGTARIRF